MIAGVDAHICDNVDPDGVTPGFCHLDGPHGGRCPGCNEEARDCEHVLRTACAIEGCRVHRSVNDATYP